MKHEVRESVDRQTELNNCTFVKTVLMLLVVFYHSILFWSGGWFTGDPAFSAPLLSPIASWLNTIHIQGFALVSGYLFSYLKYENGKYMKFLPFVQNKAKRLLVPYVFAAALWVIPVSFPFFRYDWLAILNKFVLAQSPGQLWFLVMLFGVFVIFWPLSDFFYKRDIAGAIAVLGIYGVTVIASMFAPNVFMIWTALRYLPLFWLGFKLRQHGTELIKKIPSYLWLAASVLLFALTHYLGGVDNIICKLLTLGFTFVTNVVGALTAFVVLQKIASGINWNTPIFAFLSKRSMAIYLFHQQVIYYVIAGLNGVLNPYLHAGLNFVVSTAVSLLIATVLLRFPKTRFLLGEK